MRFEKLGGGTAQNPYTYCRQPLELRRMLQGLQPWRCINRLHTAKRHLMPVQQGPPVPSAIRFGGRLPAFANMCGARLPALASTATLIWMNRKAMRSSVHDGTWLGNPLSLPQVLSLGTSEAHSRWWGRCTSTGLWHWSVRALGKTCPRMGF